MTRCDSIALVEEFHNTFGQPIEEFPTIDNTDVNQLRLDLLYEELSELRTALADQDEVGVLDALTDLQYVLDGAYLSLGFHRYKHDALVEVHRSNLSKLEDGKVIRRADGKVLKGKHYKPPALDSLLEPYVVDR